MADGNISIGWVREPLPPHSKEQVI
uniref:Uncharacterized protein n=1 Tax=Arundo donax TaxID=35708 RepID=A0A0A8ZPM2_ARUDO